MWEFASPKWQPRDVYNRGKHFKPFSSSGSGNKAHFDQCLTVVGTVNSGFYGLFLAKKSTLAFEQAIQIWGHLNTSNRELSRNVLR